MNSIYNNAGHLVTKLAELQHDRPDQNANCDFSHIFLIRELYAKTNSIVVNRLLLLQNKLSTLLFMSFT